METLTREAVLRAQHLVVEPVEVPEWGGRVFVRVMSARERDRYEIALSRQREADTWNIRALMLSCTVCDEAGALLFRPGDVDALGDQSVDVTERVAAVADRLNGLSARSVELLKKKSVSPANGSGSDSASTSASPSAH